MDVFNNTVSERQKSLHLYNFEKSVLQFLIRPVTCQQKKKKRSHSNYWPKSEDKYAVLDIRKYLCSAIKKKDAHFS